MAPLQGPIWRHPWAIPNRTVSDTLRGESSMDVSDLFRALDELKTLEFPGELFPKLHHMGVSLESHRKHANGLQTGNFASGKKGMPNRDVTRRLQFVLERARACGQTGAKPDRHAWDKLASEALGKHPINRA